MMKLGVVLLVLLGACNGDAPVPTVVKEKPAPPIDLVQENKDAIKLEKRDIEMYKRRYKLVMGISPTGVHHRILVDLPGPRVKPGQWATVNYRMELLNGVTAYATAKGKPESFMVEMDDVESGLHEAIQHLSAGDSAIFIIPSYRAHGLIGDMNKVPMRSSVVYHIGLVKIKGEPK